MKKIVKSFIITAIAIVAVACNKPAPDKSSVEAGFANPIPIPTASIDENITTDGVSATVKVTFDGVVSEAMDSLSLGLVYGTDPTFEKSTFVPVEKLENGTYTLNVNVVSKSKTYFVAAAANTGGTCYSDVIEKEIPDVAFHLKVAGKYVGKVVSEAYGDEYSQEIEIIVSEEDPTICIVSGFEPFYLKKYGLKYPKGNYCEGVIDDEKSTITVVNQSRLYLYQENDAIVVGANTDSWKTATGFADITFVGTDDGSLFRKEAFGTMSIGESGDYAFEDQYAGGVKYTKQ